MIFVPDSNVFDAFLGEPLAAERAIARHGVSDYFLVTQVQKAEILDTPDQERHSRLLALLNDFEQEQTADGVPGIPEGDAHVAADTQSAGAPAPPGRGAMQDALIVAAASTEGAVLVTDDPALRNRAEREGVGVWSPALLIEYLLE